MRLRHYWLLAATLLTTAAAILYNWNGSSDPPSSYTPRYDEIVDYWSLIQDFQTIGIPLTWIVFAVPALLGIIAVFRLSGKVQIAAALLTLNAVLCGCGFFWALIFLPVCSTELEHRQSVSFNSHHYHYTFMTDADRDCDNPNITYIVYECDLADTSCRAIYVQSKIYWADPKLAYLVADSSRKVLHFRIGDEVVYTSGDSFASPLSIGQD